MASYNAEGATFRSLFDVIIHRATVDVGSLADGAGATSAITVTGAELGDFVIASFGVDLVDMTVTAYVQAADSVEVRVQNESGAGPVDLASTTVNLLILKPGRLWDRV